MDTIIKIFNYLIHPVKGIKLIMEIRHLKKNLEEEATDLFLSVLLSAMSLAFLFDRKFRRNIEGFNAKYVFRDKTEDVYTGVIFKNNSMHLSENQLPDRNIEIVFRDAKALRNFIFSGNPDVLNAILDNKVNVDGNLNYIFKFGYMAKHLQLRFI